MFICLMTIFLYIFSYDIEIVSYVFILLLGVFLGINIYLKVFKDKFLNRLMIITMINLILTVFSASQIQVEIIMRQESLISYNVFLIIMIVLFNFFNMGMFLYYLYIEFRNYLEIQKTCGQKQLLTRAFWFVIRSKRVQKKIRT